MAPDVPNSPGPYAEGVSTKGKVRTLDAPAPPPGPEDPPEPPIVVTVAAVDGNAGEEGENPGRFVFSRADGDRMDEAVTVNYTVSGSSSASDYTLIGDATIGAGEVASIVQITPADDGLLEGAQDVKLLIADRSSDYVLNGTNPASSPVNVPVSLSIVDNELPDLVLDGMPEDLEVEPGALSTLNGGLLPLRIIVPPSESLGDTATLSLIRTGGGNVVLWDSEAMTHRLIVDDGETNDLTETFSVGPNGLDRTIYVQSTSASTELHDLAFDLAVNLIAAPAAAAPVKPKNKPNLELVDLGINPVSRNTPIDYFKAIPLNVIPNPAAIVRMPEAEAKSNNVAQLRITSTQHADFKLADDDPRVIWRVTGDVQGGQGADVGFFKVNGVADDTGRQARVFGTGTGRIIMEASLKDNLGREKLGDTLEAVVVDPQIVKYRVQLLGDGEFATRVSAAQARQHVEIARRVFYQAGILLEADDRPQSDGFNPVDDQPGIFRRDDMEPRLVRGLNADELEEAVGFNDVSKVVQIVYAESYDEPQDQEDLVQAIRVAAPANTSGPELTLSYRRFYADKRVARTMTIYEADPAQNRPDNWGLAMFNSTKGNPAEKSGRVHHGKTLAHELGHVLGLLHRRNPKPTDPGDGIGDNDNNIMAAGTPELAEDIDLIQVVAIHTSGVFAG